MTTVDSQADKALCHVDKLANIEVAEIPSDRGLPAGISPLESRVSGHTFDDERQTIGMLRGSDGRVFKPVVKPLLGKREITFYENLQVSQDPVMLQLKNYVPKYYGTTDLQVFGRQITFLMLKDITDGMAEPCVMDIKIGRRTWDPLATPEKRATEELKYAESKRTYGFCITGFQTYCASSGQLRKFGKHYGKTLDAKGVVEALKIFLNISPERPPCRQLIVKLLSFLWKILLFFRTQRLFRFYSSSLLVAYDAKRLRHYLRLRNTKPDRSSGHIAKTFSPSNSRTSTSSVFNVRVNDMTGNSIISSETSRNRTTERVHFIKRSISLSSEYDTMGKNKTLNRSGSSSPDFSVGRLCRTHSYVNNFDDDIVKMKEDYDDLLNELTSSSEEKQNWVRINMIDFTHVFPPEDPTALDLNYLEGIENLIKLVEMFLVSKDHAV
ncbi:inositol phosphate kinase 2 isoform X1 [Megachile rotundata]|uniref:inositol phosphate kinase 2 isoform X1 n=1 Tax=Megachile rotundata TaxID=143995 RepID=UPI000258DF1F|nr:PREDICTED: inositol polyphosphate multikinase [Megachile rotundata]XP_012136015.1 PREDICTED: inositol polyphosphate multikinase [Megachile rotundata]XP_012136016.1 PREDICTED: inositol polyphosphate multikinase [Megachile rotundata]XP_012136017.1 PREDICTED: inositol polyphosphate multikinase [Megachile rotundata]XP_012136018.1 PREDICTED: inositol polyphosphate multikinase [Megachile rotundata]XP_012136019.1 PREDICTED: inositol polyphosphate multikinase [Megachile rotundata]XP_012136020.1 PR